MPRNWRAWTDAERTILKTTYPQSGRQGVQAALAAAGFTRSVNEIASAAGRYGVPSGRTYLKYPPSERIDSEIIRAYQRRHKGELGAIKAMTERLGLTYGWVKWRAVQLGVVKPKVKQWRWSEEEDAILAELADMGLAAVQRELNKHGYRRSQTAILLRRERRRLSFEHPDLYCASGVGRLLGLDSKTIGRWIRRDGLKAQKKRLHVPKTDPGDPQNWCIHRKDLARWLRDHPAHWDVRRVTDHYWLVELLAGEPKVSE